MVKRIKKRVVKEEAVEAVEAVEEITETELPEEPQSTADQLSAAFEQAADDDFTRKTAGLFQWLIAKRAVLIGLAAVAVVAVVVVLYMNSQKQAAAEAASTALNEATETYVKTLPTGDDSDDPAKRKTQLAAAKAAFKAAVDAHPEAAIVGLAELGAAGSAFDLGDFDGAAAGFDKALATDLDPLAKAVALQGKAAALEAKGDAKGALEQWRSVEKLGKTFGLQARVQQGRLMEGLGDKKGARKLYEATQKDFADELKNFGNALLKRELDQRLAGLGQAS